MMKGKEEMMIKNLKLKVIYNNNKMMIIVRIMIEK